MIIDVHALFDSVLIRDGSRDLRSYLEACYPRAAIPPMTLITYTAEPMIGRVNHGIWIASCLCGMPGLPRPGCVLDLTNPLGWCVRCSNGYWSGGWRPVILPPPDVRESIEAVLDCRARVEDRNWDPTESIDDLIQQNLAHRERVPVSLKPQVKPTIPSITPLRSDIGRILREMKRR